MGPKEMQQKPKFLELIYEHERLRAPLHEFKEDAEKHTFMCLQLTNHMELLTQLRSFLRYATFIFKRRLSNNAI